jgi:hypothetical protein
MKTRKEQRGKEKVKGKKVKGERRRHPVARPEVPPASEENQYDPWPHLHVGYRGPRPRLPPVPPPDSDVWPPEYRGARWKRIYATLFAGKCLLCQYSFAQPASRQAHDRWLRQDTPLLCTNCAACPGEMIEVRRTDTCRNFKRKHWRSAARKKTPPVTPPAWPPKRKKGVRRVPLTDGLFATVDAADYKEIRKYKWSVSRRGRHLYAQARVNGRTALMHRFLMRPRKGRPVDHIDGNGLNNCRSNLRECTLGQNVANQRPRGGSSRFVGVRRRGDRWQASITCRGRHYSLGCYDDEVEAAKARDRKAVELHGVYAYLNFPEDWTFDKNGVGHPARPRRRRR